MNPPLVSLIVDNYNYGRFLKRCLDSCLNQDYPNLEVIAVDDGSTDDSLEILKSYESRIPVFHTKRCGQTGALNLSFEHSHGSLVLFLDADDYLLPHAVEELTKAWRPDTSVLHYYLMNVNPAGEVIPQKPLVPRHLSGENVVQALHDYGYYTWSPQSGCVFDAKILKKLFPLPVDHWLSADAHLSRLCPFFGERTVLPKVLACKTTHGANFSPDNNGFEESFSKKILPYRVSKHAVSIRFFLKACAERDFAVNPNMGRRSSFFLFCGLACLKLWPESYPREVAGDFSLLQCLIGIFEDYRLRPRARLRRAATVLLLYFTPGWILRELYARFPLVYKV